MSFILDALKKSENERRQQQANDFATVPSGRASPPAPRWLWMLGLLLAINIVVVAALLMMRTTALPPASAAGESVPGVSRPPSAEPAVEVGTPRTGRAGNEAAVTPPDTAASAAFANQLAVARREQPPAPADPVRPGAAAGTPSPAPAGMATLPSLEELRLKGAVDLPPLHIDLHVYNESASRRFVSINMSKYRENERLAEGPVLKEITPEGVVLEYQGKAFALLQ